MKNLFDKVKIPLILFMAFIGTWYFSEWNYAIGLLIAGILLLFINLIKK